MCVGVYVACRWCVGGISQKLQALSSIEKWKSVYAVSQDTNGRLFLECI